MQIFMTKKCLKTKANDQQTQYKIDIFNLKKQLLRQEQQNKA